MSKPKKQELSNEVLMHLLTMNKELHINEPVLVEESYDERVKRVTKELKKRFNKLRKQRQEQAV